MTIHVRFKPPWREAGSLNHHNDKVNSEQEAVNNELSMSVHLLPIDEIGPRPWPDDQGLSLRHELHWYSSQLKNNHFTEMCSDSEAGSYARLIDACLTQIQARES